MKLSIIIINYKSYDIINRCINCIETEYSHEIIVVDNDGKLPDIDKDATILPYLSNDGFSGANNRALLTARGEYILFLNADVFLTNNYIDKCITFLDKNKHHSSVQGKLLKESNHCLIDSTGNVITRSYYAFNENHLHQDSLIPSHEIFGVCCAAGIFRKRHLDKIIEQDKIFDTDFFAYLEDVDLNIRLRKKGLRAHFLSDAIGHHIRESSSSFAYRLRQSVLNRYLLVVKHSSIAHMTATSLLSIPSIILLVPEKKHTFKKIRNCWIKRNNAPSDAQQKPSLDSNYLFFRHIFRRLTHFT